MSMFRLTNLVLSDPITLLGAPLVNVLDNEKESSSWPPLPPDGLEPGVAAEVLQLIEAADTAYLRPRTHLHGEVQQDALLPAIKTLHVSRAGVFSLPGNAMGPGTRALALQASLAVEGGGGGQTAKAGSPAKAAAAAAAAQQTPTTAPTAPAPDSLAKPQRSASQRKGADKGTGAKAEKGPVEAGTDGADTPVAQRSGRGKAAGPSAPVSGAKRGAAEAVPSEAELTPGPDVRAGDVPAGAQGGGKQDGHKDEPVPAPPKRQKMTSRVKQVDDAAAALEAFRLAAEAMCRALAGGPSVEAAGTAAAPSGKEPGGSRAKHSAAKPLPSAPGSCPPFPPSVSGAEVRQLLDAALRARAAGSLASADPSLLQRLLGSLLLVIEPGRHQTLYSPGPEGPDRAFHVVSMALDAASAALTVMTVEGGDRTLYLEEVVDACVLLSTHHLSRSILPVYSPKVRAAVAATRQPQAAGAQGRAGGEGPSSSKAFVREPYMVSEEEEDSEENDGAKGSRAKGRGMGAGGRRGRGARAATAADALAPSPKHLRHVEVQVESLLGQLRVLVRSTKLQPGLVESITRSALQAVGVEGVPLLQLRAMDLLCSVFGTYADERQVILDDVFATMAPLMGAGISKAAASRGYEVRASPSHPAAHIQVASALLILLVQAVPSVQGEAQAGEEGEGQREHQLGSSGFRPAPYWADHLWRRLLERAATETRAKADLDVDWKAFVMGLVSDAIAVLSHPEWPAAPLMLTHLALVLGQGAGGSPHGLKSTDASTRGLAIDLVGQVAAALSQIGPVAEADAQWAAVEAGKALALPSPPPLPDLRGAKPDTRFASQVERAVLGYLSQEIAERGTESTELGSAYRFLVSKGCAEAAPSTAADGMAKGKGTTDAVAAARGFYDRTTLPPEHECCAEISGEGAARLCRVAVHYGAVGRLRALLLQWMLEATEAAKEAAATVRSRAIRSLASIVVADPRVLQLRSVRGCVDRCLQDDAVLVREGALDLMGRHMAREETGARGQRQTDWAPALGMFDLLARAIDDPGLSVRKRAIKILWKGCLSRPGFPRAGEACAVLMARATDEPGLQALIGSIFYDLWLNNQGGAGGEGSRWDPEEAARSMAGAAISAGDGASVGRTHLLVQVLARAISHGVTHASMLSPSGAAEGHAKKKGRLAEKERSPHPLAQVASALLELASPADEDGGGSEGEAPRDGGQQMGSLLAIQAILQVAPSVCLPGEDPAKFIRALLPLCRCLVEDQMAPGGNPPDQRMAQLERLLCLLHTLWPLLAAAPSLERGAAAALEHDLVECATRHASTQLLAAALKLLCSLVRVHPPTGETLAVLAKLFYGRTVEGLQKLRGAGAECDDRPRTETVVRRGLYVLGQLSRWGLDEVELRVEEEEGGGAGAVPGPEQLLSLSCGLCLSPNVSPGLKDAGAQCLMGLLAARPQLLLDKRCEKVFNAALQLSAAPGLKQRILGGLVDLLRTEDEEMLREQESKAAEARATVSGTRLKSEADRPVVARENDESGNCSLVSGLVRLHLDAILSVAREGVWEVDGAAPASLPATPGVPASTPMSAASMEGARGAAQGLAAKNRAAALELISISLRQGAVPPWSTVPALVALATDPAPDTAARALSQLKMLVDKYPSMVASFLADGIAEAFNFHNREGAAAAGPGGRAPSTSPAAGLFATSSPRGGILPDTAIAGFGEVYKLIRDSATIRSKFLSTMVRRFDTYVAEATSSHQGPGPSRTQGTPSTTPAATPRGAGESWARPSESDAPLYLLAFCAQVLASLPYGRAIEPLEVVAAAAGILSRHSHAVQSALKPHWGKRAMEARGMQADTPASPHPEPAPSEASMRFSVALSLLLLLKRHLRVSYSLSNERIAALVSGGPEARRKEEKDPAVRAAALEGQGQATIDLSDIDLEAHRGGPDAQRSQYTRFKTLLQEDAADYTILHAEAMLLGGKKKGGRRAAAAHAAGVGAEGAAPAKQPPSGGRSRGRGRASAADTVRKGKARKGKAKRVDSDSEEEDDAGDADGVAVVEPVSRSSKRTAKKKPRYAASDDSEEED